MNDRRTKENPPGGKLLVIVNDLTMGGAERQALLLARAAHAGGRSVGVVGLSKPGPLADVLKDDGIPCVRCELEFPLSVPRMPCHAWRLARFLRRLHPRTILGYTSVPCFYGAWVWRRTGARRFVWNQRSAGLYRPPPALERLGAKRTPAFIANSQSAEAFLRGELQVAPGSIHRIPNGVVVPDSVPDRALSRAKAGIDGEPFVACMVGNLRQPKDPLTLLRAWQRVRSVLAERNRAAVLVFVGRIVPGFCNVDAMAAALGIGDSVRCIGFQQDVSDLLAVADLAVFSSRSEGMPNAVLESMASGLAVAATDLPGIRECLPERQYSFLAAPGDSGPLADAILRLAGDGELRAELGRLNREYVRTTFPVQAMVDQTLAVVDEI